jgi:8-hydroxy-5-deazaflavin:NADPH oxidoreductase
MTTIGFIGSGNIGGTVARLAVAAGYDVVLSNSRGPATLADLVASLGPHARAATPAEAAGAGELVVVSVPYRAFRDLPVAALAGKIVLDTNNYYPQRDGHFASLDDKSLTSIELEQQFLTGATLVKVFNNINYRHLGSLNRPAGAADRSTLTIAGDDPDAKKKATAFLDAIGYDAYDVGTLADSWRVEVGQPAYARLYGSFGSPGHTVTADDIRKAVAAAKR